jgi:NAD(P)H-dependent flavin oxidoreductase YrpB (nitropropane dioxygenase family)
MAPPALNTPLTKLLGIKYPIMLAGMARTSGGELAAAVSNAGGIGTIGGLGYTPKQLQEVLTTSPSPTNVSPFHTILISSCTDNAVSRS